MIKELLTKYLDTQKIQYETHVDLKKRTWIHRGGIAGIYISPASADELETIVSFLYSEDISFLLIGHTSNLYILNECNIPVVVSTAKCRYFQIEDGQLFCEAGVGVINLSKQMIKQGIKGFEYLTGLPGTIGAALVNNSSCRENSISELLVSARVVLKDGSIKIFLPEDFKYEFRNSVFKKREVEGTIISTVLKVTFGDAAKMQQMAEENDQDRAKRLEGYTKNLGTDDELTASKTVYGMGLDIDQLFTVNVNLSYNLPHWQIGLEYSPATAWYGTIDQKNGKVGNTHAVTNHRILGLVMYYF